MKKTHMLAALALSFSLLFIGGIHSAQASTCAPGTFANGVICGATLTTNGYFATSQNLLFTEQEAIMFGNYLNGNPETSTPKNYSTYTTKKNVVTNTPTQSYDDYYSGEHIDDDVYYSDEAYDTTDDYSGSYNDYSDEYEYTDEEEYQTNKSNSGTYKENDW